MYVMLYIPVTIMGSQPLMGVHLSIFKNAISYTNEPTTMAASWLYVIFASQLSVVC